MNAPRRSALAPSFVVVLAASAAACSVLDPLVGPSQPSPPSNPHPCDTGCSNPPAPPPLAPPARPDFGQTVTQAKAPPPLGSASLIVTADGEHAVATDPDRDRVVIADLANASVREVKLPDDSVPGRLVEDDAHRVHVVLERGRSVATIDVASGTIAFTREACGAPQGIARSGSDLFVACTDGELVKLPVGNAPAARLTRTFADLRDVVVSGSSLLVSRLRTAEVLRIAITDGRLLARARRPATSQLAFSPGDREASVGWRLVSHPAGGAVLVHQMANAAMVPAEQPSAYAGVNPCDGSVVSEVTRFDVAEGTNALEVRPDVLLGDAVLPVDLAARPDGSGWAAIAAGNGHTKELPQVHLLPPLQGSTDCSVPRTSGVMTGRPVPSGRVINTVQNPPGQAVAAAFTPDSASLVVFTREPAAIHVHRVDGAGGWATIAAGGASREDTGHAIFHSNTGGRIACASCHPNGADDGRVWTFSDGARRTQTLRGTLAGTAPYHWSGNAPDMASFATNVFAGKMGGQELALEQVSALRVWAENIPAEPVTTSLDAAAVARGKTLFESAAVGCTSCHAGPKLTNSESVDVGTGGTFQVPSLLGLAVRAPYLHDGSVPTLLDRFGPAGGGDAHGTTSQLGTADLVDLVTYLQSL